MPIDSDTLDSWATPRNAATDSAKRTHKKIRDELESSDKFPDDVSYDTFLQGSYANHTLVRGSSDVDIVLRLTSAVMTNGSDLSKQDRARWKSDLTDPGYSWQQFRTDAVGALEDRFGSDDVEQGSKAVKLDTTALPLEADVLVAQKYKRYYNYPSGFYTGVVFWDLTGTQIVNYPKRHINRGSTKQTDTSGRFKETVRIFKRARNYLASNGDIDKDNVASYFIENLLYRVPDGRYVYDKQDRYVQIVEYLRDTDYSGWTCQNNVTDLFGYGSTKWSTRYADRYVDALIDLWEDA